MRRLPIALASCLLQLWIQPHRTTAYNADNSNIDIKELLRKKGCITTLNKSNKEYDRLIKRNLSIQKYISPLSLNIDVIIFHEDVMPEDHITLLQKATPNLPLTFIRVDEIFQRENKWNTFGFCKANAGTKMFSLGYKRMCRFWFSEFFKLLYDYSWMIRVDLDCEFISEIPEFFSLHGVVNYATVKVLHLNQRAPDDIDISANFEGSCVTGLGFLVNDFINSSTSIANLNSWTAPYTNVFFVNLHWLNSTSLLHKFYDYVDISGCIFSNRWGDLPLWGAALAVLEEPMAIMNTSYIHGSHRRIVHPYVLDP